MQPQRFVSLSNIVSIPKASGLLILDRLLPPRCLFTDNIGRVCVVAAIWRQICGPMLKLRGQDSQIRDYCGDSDSQSVRQEEVAEEILS